MCVFRYLFTCCLPVSQRGRAISLSLFLLQFVFFIQYLKKQQFYRKIGNTAPYGRWKVRLAVYQSRSSEGHLSAFNTMETKFTPMASRNRTTLSKRERYLTLTHTHL